MLKFLANMQVRLYLKGLNEAQKKQFLNWDKIKKIAIVVNHQATFNKQNLLQYIGKWQKDVTVIFIEPHAKSASHEEWQCIVKKDLNLLKLPKQRVLTSLKQQTFDLVISTADAEDNIAQMVSAAIPAELKSATVDTHVFANLVIKKNVENQLIQYLEEVIRYLKMIKN